MYATSYDPAAGLVFSLVPSQSVQLTSSRTYETGAKQLLWDGRAEWTFAVYDTIRRNVLVSINDTTSALAGEEESKGYELAGAVRPIEGLKLWGNIAWTHARWESFDVPVSDRSGAIRRPISRRSSSMRASPIVSSVGDGRWKSALRCVMSATVSCSTTI